MKWGTRNRKNVKRIGDPWTVYSRSNNRFDSGMRSGEVNRPKTRDEKRRDIIYCRRAVALQFCTASPFGPTFSPIAVWVEWLRKKVTRYGWWKNWLDAIWSSWLFTSFAAASIGEAPLMTPIHTSTTPK